MIHTVRTTMGIGSVFCKKNYPVERRNDTWKLYANVAMHRDVLNLRMICMKSLYFKGLYNVSMHNNKRVYIFWLLYTLVKMRLGRIIRFRLENNISL